MADNLVLNLGSGGSTCLTDDCTSGHAQFVKLAIATDGSPTPLGGWLLYHTVSAASTNAANVKASAGQLHAIDVFNVAAYPVYVKFHNTAGAPTAGSGVVMAFGVQSGVPRQVTFPFGVAFSTGIAVTIVKDITDAGATAVAASDCVVDVVYR